MNRRNRSWTSALAILAPLIALPAAGFAQPNLTAFSFTPTSINTASGPATVTVNFQATDTSGIFYFEMAFVDPSGVFFQRGFQLLAPSTSVSGSVVVPFPAFSNGGTWTVAGVFMADVLGNTTFLDTAALSLRFSTNLQVNSTTDTVPPSLTSLSLSSPSIDTTSGPANLSVNFTATDPQAGVQSVQVTLLSPAGDSSPTVTVTVPPNPTLTSAANFTFPKLSEPGTWTIQSVFILDAAGNSTLLQTSDLAGRFPTSFTVVSTKDTTPPTLVSLNFSPTNISTKLGPVTVTIGFQLTDNLSGATTFQAGFVSPSGVTTVTASASFPANTSVTGSASAIFPMGSEPGTWTLASVFVSDAAGNTTTLSSVDLASRGLPTQLTVSSSVPPSITPNVSPAPGPSGWNTTVPVTVSWAVTDPSGTGIASTTGCGTTQLTANTPGTTLTCSATNGAGLSASASVTVRIDTTPPVIVPTVTPTPNSAGWNNSSATVTWSVTDTVSGISSSTGCTPTTITTQTAGTTLTCTATSNAGLTATASVTVKLDETPPTISGMPAAGCTIWPPNQKLVQVAVVTASDALSGLLPGSFQVTAVSNQPQNDPQGPDIVITPTGTGGYTVQLRADRLGPSTDRIYTVTGTAQDVAGNLTTVNATCTVPHDQGNGH